MGSLPKVRLSDFGFIHNDDSDIVVIIIRMSTTFWVANITRNLCHHKMCCTFLATDAIPAGSLEALLDPL